MDLDVAEVGEGGTLVAFAHGVLDRGRSFEAVGGVLDGECRMIWYDRRGYGEPVDDPVGIGGHVDDLVALLAGRRAVVVGHSFGGIIALATAVRAPELVSAVVVYETAVAWAPGWDDAVMESVLADDDPEGAGLRLMFGDRYDAGAEEAGDRRRSQAAAFIAEERSIRLGPPPFDLSAIRAPVVYGRSDPLVMPAVVEHLQRHIPRLEVVTVPGAGHHAHRTAPEAFADLVRRGVALADGS